MALPPYLNACFVDKPLLVTDFEHHQLFILGVDVRVFGEL